MLLQSRKVAPHGCPPKLLFKVATESRNSKAVPRSCLKAGPESCPKLLPKAAPQSCSPKLFPGLLRPKAVAPKLRLFKPIPQNGSPKLFCKATPESCFPKVATESCSPKWFVKRSLKAAVLQSNYSSIFSGKVAKAAPQSSSPKLLPKAVPQSVSAKRLPQSRYASNLFPLRLPKAILQSGSQKLSPKLLPKAAPQSCVLQLVYKVNQTVKSKPLKGIGQPNAKKQSVAFSLKRHIWYDKPDESTKVQVRRSPFCVHLWKICACSIEFGHFVPSSQPKNSGLRMQRRQWDCALFCWQHLLSWKHGLSCTLNNVEI